MSCISVLTTYCQRCFTQAHTTTILKTQYYLIQSIVKEPIQSSRHMKPIQSSRHMHSFTTKDKRPYMSVSSLSPAPEPGSGVGEQKMQGNDVLLQHLVAHSNSRSTFPLVKNLNGYLYILVFTFDNPLTV